MERIFRGIALLGVALCLGVAMGHRAEAHAILITSAPQANATVAGPAIAFTLRFNSRIDAKRSRLTLIRSDQSQQVLPIHPGPSADVLETAADLDPGTYTLRWQVLAIDGHITRGDVPFTVSGR